MLKFLLFLLFLITCLELAHLASFIPQKSEQQLVSNVEVSNRATISANYSATSTTMNTPVSVVSQLPVTQTTKTTTTTNNLQEPDSDDSVGSSTGPPPNSDGPTVASNSPQPDNSNSNNNNNNNNSNNPNQVVNSSKPSEPSPTVTDQCKESDQFTEVDILFYSIFIVYVSFVKLVYHNVALVKRYLTEPG